jgi:trimethylamine:corrinoid methyltransferase-like protein
MALMLTSVLFGTRVFVGGGRLSLDEVFSPEQLVIDCEMRDHVQRLIAGIDGDCDPSAVAAEVATGIQEGFLGLESTVGSYRDLFWMPRLFERRTLGGWMAAGSPDFREHAKEMVREAAGRHQYELEPELRRKLDDIYARAQRDLAG